MLLRKSFIFLLLFICACSVYSQTCYDLTNDNRVNLHDLVYAAKRIGTTDASADIDGDMSVTAADLIPLLGKMGPCQTPLPSCTSGSLVSARCRCSIKSY